MPEKGKEKMDLITLHLPKAWIKGLEELVEKKRYYSRSEAIRFAIRDLLMREYWDGEPEDFVNMNYSRFRRAGNGHKVPWMKCPICRRLMRGSMNKRVFHCKEHGKWRLLENQFWVREKDLEG